ncbi:unnamed protein product [Cylindrotheca closterium]|uniref:Major facilitator superfamily (MFS) profile domain-containing protein n=1 Tax=Cylindrotheca closterium TaxID=2856 RepID=A0AAD2PWC7_9STRA|nr:unnamed protein product [Cylindrotheca closterium]
MPGGKLQNQRYRVAFILCLANALCYACRMNIGIALPHFVPDNGDRGIVLSAFFYGYICTQVPAGYFAKRVGVKQVLATGVLVWTFCDFFTILTYPSLFLLSLVRAGMGCGEGVTMTSLHIFASYWFPANERATLVAMVTSGSDLGNILALLISPWLIQMTDGRWQVIYIVFSILSMVWLVFFMRHVTSNPQEHSLVSKLELDLIQLGSAGLPIIEETYSSSSSQGKIKKATMPWRILLTSRHLWVIYASHFAANYSWYILLCWLPTYLTEALGWNLSEHPGLTVAPYVCGYLGLLLSGRLSDFLITERKIPTLYVRKMMHSIGSFLPAAFLYVLPYTPPSASITAIGLLSGCLFFGRACTSGFWINMIDVGGPDHAGSIMSISNSIGTLPGILGNVVTGYLLQQQQQQGTSGKESSWIPVFHLASAVSAIGGVIFLFGATDRNVFDTVQLRKHKDDDEGVEFDRDPLLLES